MRPLDFRAARDDGGDSWERAHPEADGTVIARLRYNQFGVALHDSTNAHIVRIRAEGDGYVGECDCKGYKFGSGPCAHLATVRKAEFIGATDASGQRVRIPDAAEAADHHVEQAVAADGGVRR